ncbi:MAG: CbiX/SirB N-terminal domain-containing protein [Pseudomonadota bacterium]
MDRRGIILFAHGSRDPLWHVPIEAVAEVIRARDSSALVCCAYLELSTPDLAQAAGELIAAGARQLRVFPLFLGVGKHAREDLPRLVAQLRTQYPELVVELMPAAGEYPQLTDLMASIALS